MAMFRKSAAKRTVKISKKPSRFGKNSGNSKSPAKETFSEKKAKGVTGFAGTAGFRQAKQEKRNADENRRRNSLPWRYWMAPGSEGEVILLDEQPFFMYEHQFKGSDDKPAFERCIKDVGHCPMCSKLNREGHYVMMLTCIDLRPYKTRKGEKIKMSKKLYPVKQSQIPKFERIFNKEESFRGVKLHLYRDGDKDSVIGSDIEYVETLAEIKMKKFGDLAKPVNYEEAFPRLSEEAMSKRYGTGMPLGSSDTSKDDDEDDDADNEEW